MLRSQAAAFQVLVKLCRGTDMDLHPSYSLKGSVAWSKHMAAAKLGAGSPPQLAFHHGHGRASTQPRK